MVNQTGDIGQVQFVQRISIDIPFFLTAKQGF
jgi:hypothetical protein